MKLRNLFFVTVAFVCLLFGSCAKDVIDLTGAIKGSVKNANGAFVEDCIISLNPTGKSQVTSINGTFEFSKLDPNNYTLTFRKDGYSDQQKRVEVLSGMISNIDVILEYAYGTIKGTVKDEKDGHTIENCQISLSPGGISKMTGADGVFVFDNLSAGIYTLTYRKEGYADQTKSITVVAGKSVDADVALKHAYGSIKGVVKDKDDGHSVENCWVRTTPGDKEIRSDANGVFEFAKLPIGDYTVSFERSGYRTVSKEAKVSGGDILDMGDVWITLENPFSVSDESVKFNNSEDVKTFTVFNNCDGNCSYEFSNIPQWLSVSPQQGTIEKQSEKEVKLTVNRDKVDYGEHTEKLKLKYSGRASGEISIEVIIEKIQLTKPEVTINTPQNISTTGFDVGGNIISTGGTPILDYGHCWSREENPTIEDNTSSKGECDREQSFTSSISGLEAYTTYYVRAYARNAQGISYSKQLEVKTKDALTQPEVSIASSATNISETGFDISGSVVSTGGTSITEYGHCWNTYGTPTVNGNKTNLGSRDNTGSFTSNITRLEANTTYYIRAYAVNSKGTSYSKEITVTTKRAQTKPEVTISNATNITEEGFDIGGSIVSTGGLSINSYGHCWSTYENPTINDSKNNLGQRSGTGSFTSNISGLKANTTYYVRAFAENDEGISYSQQMKVTTLETYGDKWDGNIASSFAGGSGTKINPYIIENGGQLLLMKDYSSSYFKLANDIDLDNHNWLPFEFSGELNGNACTIYNLSVNRNTSDLGLFSTLNGSVKNLTVRGVKIKGANVGVIAGSLRTGEISNCHIILASNSELQATQNVGGFIGYVRGNVAVYNSTIETMDENATIYGGEAAGGIIGMVMNGDVTQVHIIDCHVSCNISAISNIGGILGGNRSYCHDSNNVEDSHYIKNCEYSGKMIGESNIGGILGSTTYAFNIYSCKADVSIEVENGWAGGILGSAYKYRTCSAIACYSMGTIKSIGYGSINCIGGIVGGANLGVDYGGKYQGESNNTAGNVELSYSTITSSLSEFSGIGYCDKDVDSYYVFDCSNITTSLKDCYSNHASYWNFNNQWTWSGTVNGQNKHVKCPRLAWE